MTLLPVMMMNNYAYVYSETPVDVPKSHIAWVPPNSVQDDDTRMITCVSMLAHPFNAIDSIIDTTKIIHIMVIAPLYTVYKEIDIQEECSDGEWWNVAATDTYDIMSELTSPSKKADYKRVNVKPVRFLSEAAANAKIAPSLLSSALSENGKSRWYNNFHNVIDQFVYERGQKNATCAHKDGQGDYSMMETTLSKGLYVWHAVRMTAPWERRYVRPKL
ncbi:hypothetical protein ElyMa_004524000 [Elysia marginata]|uniref:Uncharacterized protein n=1 Tax=Elysia marginata TaxID=1093978 RepID=A0AAV4HR69_9GAST|nr:hypothetical protein ElyMa_004524000 [Elysia marginata]